MPLNQMLKLESTPCWMLHYTLGDFFSAKGWLAAESILRSVVLAQTQLFK